MRLTADRLLVVEGETLRAIALVGASKMAVAVAGGLPHLRHAIEDAGFHSVTLFEAPPSAWGAERERPATPDLTWIVWLEATASRTASLTRDLTEELSITNAWPVEADRRAPLLSAYAVTPGDPRRLAGFVVAFGVAYALAMAGAA